MLCDRPTFDLIKKPNGTWTKPSGKYCVSKDDRLLSSSGSSN